MKNKPTDLSWTPKWRPPQGTPVERWAGAGGSSGGGNAISINALMLLNAVLVELLKEAGQNGKKTGLHTGSREKYLGNVEHPEMNGPAPSAF